MAMGVLLLQHRLCAIGHDANVEFYFNHLSYVAHPTANEKREDASMQKAMRSEICSLNTRRWMQFSGTALARLAS